MRTRTHALDVTQRFDVVLALLQIVLDLLRYRKLGDVVAPAHMLEDLEATAVLQRLQRPEATDRVEQLHRRWRQTCRFKNDGLI